MDNYLSIVTITLFIISLVFVYKRTLTYLHIFQQQEYDNTRFLTWIFSNYAIDKRATIALLILLVIYAKIPADFFKNFCLYSGIKLLSVSIVLLAIAIIEKNPLKFAKKKLAFTNRAKRIYFTAILINLIFNIFLILNIYHKNNIVNLFILIHTIPFYLILSNLILLPVEKYIQHNIRKIASQKLSNLQPIIIGITGSFGKTSVKHFLGQILSQADHTLITSGSINTSMGIARVIKEQLNKNHKYFVVEMGAYGPGSIAKLCELTPPIFGIITAVGMAHYERFKDLETVAAAKFELAAAVIHNNSGDQDSTVNPAKFNSATSAHSSYNNLDPKISAAATDSNYNKIDAKILTADTASTHDNINSKICAAVTDSNCNTIDPKIVSAINQFKPVIIPEQVINTNYAKIYTTKHGNYFNILDPKAISNIHQSKHGLTWNLNIDGIIYQINTPIFGLHNVNNLSLAIVAAYQLKIPMATIILAVKTMPQIRHRLEVRQENNITIIDDSYNSNPEGLRSALELLSLLAQNSGRRILITPGLVELGSKHTEEHFQLGVFAAKHVDILIVVNLKRIKSLYTGFKQAANQSQQLLDVGSFAEAQIWLQQHALPNDVVLLANDLPDLYETELKI